MNIKRIIIMGGVIACLLFFANGVQALSLEFQCTKEANPIFDLDGITKLATGDVVQVIVATQPTSPTTPDAFGLPTGGDYVTKECVIGKILPPCTMEGEIHYVVGVPTGVKVYLRAWNSDSIATATKYGNSVIHQVPGTGFFDWFAPPSFSTTWEPSKPAGPAWLIGTAESTTSIKWTWAGVTNAATYELWTGTAPKTFIRTIEAPGAPTVSTVEVGLPGPNRAVTREVGAIKDGGVITLRKGPITGYTAANTPIIGAAKGGYNSGSKNYVSVTWEANGNPGGTNYRLVKLGSPETSIPLTTQSPQIDGNLSFNQTFTYSVEALNGSGLRSPFSGTVTATTPPGKPTLSTSGVTFDAITWNWTTMEGANRYNFYINGLWISTTEVSRITPSLEKCKKYSGTVEAVSNANGTGEPRALSRWTLPVTPPQVQGTSSEGTPKAVDIKWDTDENINATYLVSFSLLTNEGYLGENSPTPDATAMSGTFGGDVGSTLYYWRVRAMNGDLASSGYSELQQIRTSAGDTIPGVAPTIQNVIIGNSAYRMGMVTGSRPRITATITYDADAGIDLDYTYVSIDEDNPDPAKRIYFAASEVTYEAPGPGMPLYSYKLSALSASPMQGLPAGGSHTLKIRVRDAAKSHGSVWTGYVGVMSGGVQMIGSAYNYPNPFRPLSTDPNQNTTRISYNLSVDAAVTLIIYDITGHEVYRKTSRAGSDGGQAGLNSVPFNGQSMFGEALGNGMYLYKLISGSSVIGSGKLVVLD